MLSAGAIAAKDQQAPQSESKTENETETELETETLTEPESKSHLTKDQIKEIEERLKDELNQKMESDGFVFSGYMDSGMEAQPLEQVQEASLFSIRDSLPDRYSAVEDNQDTAIKDQGDWGACVSVSVLVSIWLSVSVFDAASDSALVSASVFDSVSNSCFVVLSDSATAEVIVLIIDSSDSNSLTVLVSMHNRIKKSIAGILCMVTCITASVDTYAAENIHNFSSVRLQTEEALQYNTESMSDIASEVKETRTVSELESEESIISTMTSAL